MTAVSHREAKRLIQQASLGEEGAKHLDNHLQDCEECSSYAGTDQFLRRGLKLSPVRTSAPPAIRRAVLAHAQGGRHHNGTQSITGSLAFLVILTLIGVSTLYAFIVTAPGNQPMQVPLAEQLASPLQTMVAIIAPPVTKTPEPSPTSRPVPQSPSGRIVVDVPAPSLANNIIGETTVQPVAVILPPSYATSDRRYPVAFLFLSGNQTPDRTDEDDLAELIVEKLASQGLMQEMIVVVPGVRTVLDTEAIIANSPVTGNWEDYVVEDLVPFIDQNFRTLPQAASRGLAGGAQVGGLNVLNLALHHADVFSVVHSQQPWLMAPGRVAEDLTLQPAIRQRASNAISRLASVPPQQASEGYGALLKTVSMRSPMRRALAYGMAIATTSQNNAPYFDYPYVDSDTPAPEEVWQRWESIAGNWAAKIDRYLAGPDRLKAIAISRDQDWVFTVENDAIDTLVQQLSAADVPVALKTTDRYGSALVVSLENDVLPFLSQNLTSD